MKKKLLLSLILISCSKSLNNSYDPATSAYMRNYFFYGTFVKNIIFPPPAAPSNVTSSNGTNQLVFYSGLATTDLSITATGAFLSYSISPELPAGISLTSSTGNFSGTPTTITSAKQYTAVACNVSGCASGSLSIKVINATATRVYGQGGDFAVTTSNNGGRSANSLSSPHCVIVDPSGGVYISDTGNVRVLYYPSGSTTATRVYGQNGSFTTSTSGTTSTTFGFSGVGALALDSSGALYVADGFNKRVLYFPPAVTTASQVYAQSGSFTTSNSGTSASTVNAVSGIAVDSSGGLYLVDGGSFSNGNNRVLYFPVGSFNTATRVYGQGGSFTSAVANKNGISADSLSSPNGVALDPSGGLYISDAGNNRVLYFSNPTSTTATQVYGTSDFTSSNSQDTNKVTSLSGVLGVFGDSSGVYVALSGRVIYFPQNLKKHILSYGQDGLLNSFSGSSAGTTASLISSSSSVLISVFVSTDGKVFISDSIFNRVLMY